MRTRFLAVLLVLAAAPALAAVTDEFAISVNGFNEFLRSNGVYLLPRQHVAIAAVDDVPGPPAGRRIQIVFVELDAADPSYGKVIEAFPAAFTGGSTDLRGLTATSFVDHDGSVDGLLIAADKDPARVLATTINGRASTGGILGTTTVAGIASADLLPNVIPAVESGTFDGETRILMAFASPGSTIRVGLLSRAGATWTFRERSQISTFDPGEFDCGQPTYEISAAYDATRHEFTVAWECGAFATYARRFDWNGVPVGPAFLAHTGPEALHSGTTLSYNRISDRYYFSFQHNSALLTPDGAGGFSCPPDPAVGCQTSVPCTAHGGHWAAEVNYESCYDFRSGGDHVDTSKPGSNYDLVSGRESNACSDVNAPPHDWVWDEQLWPVRDGSALHEYVRCPSNDVTVAIHGWSDSNEGVHEVRYSFLEEPRAFAFDDDLFTTITARYGLISVLHLDEGFANASHLGTFPELSGVFDAFEQLGDPPPGDGYYQLWRRLGQSFGEPAVRDELDLIFPTGSCQADLLVHRFELSGGCVLGYGEELQSRVRAEVANIGSATTPSTTARYYLSTDPIITTADRLLIGGRDTIPALTPEVVFSVPTSMTVPNDWPAGPAYLGLLIDEFDSIAECDETNNTRAIPVTVE